MPRPPQKPGDGSSRPGDDDLSPRARRIRDMIEAGTYRVDLDALADAIASSGDLERVGPDTCQPAANDQRRAPDERGPEPHPPESES